MLFFVILRAYLFWVSIAIVIHIVGNVLMLQTPKIKTCFKILIFALLIWRKGEVTKLKNEFFNP